MLQIKMSAGELFELVRPAALVASAILSTWVLVSARKRFPLLQALLWAIGTLLLPLIVAPIYLAVLLFKRPRTRGQEVCGRWIVPLVYSALLLGTIAAYLNVDSESVDSHLARASQARVNNDRLTTIREYQSAIALEDDAHTHKLLGIELADSGRWTEALSEFRLAELKGEPDDLIHFYLGQLLDRLNLQGEAVLEYRTFLSSELCSDSELDNRCQTARMRVDGVGPP